MISIADLDGILDLMLKHGLQSLEVREGETRLVLKLTGTGPEKLAGRDEIVVRTRAIGRFLLTHPRRTEPQVRIGDQVQAATIVGFLQSGATILPVLAGHAGEVSRIDAKPGELLGFGAPVMTLLAEPRA